MGSELERSFNVDGALFLKTCLTANKISVDKKFESSSEDIIREVGIPRDVFEQFDKTNLLGQKQILLDQLKLQLDNSVLESTCEVMDPRYEGTTVAEGQKSFSVHNPRKLRIAQLFGT